MAETWHIISAFIAIMLIAVGVAAVVLVIVRVIQSRRIEIQTAANSQEVASAMGEIKTTLYKICDGLTAGGQMSRDNQEDLRRMIRDCTELILDVEKRLGSEIKSNREWITIQLTGRRDGTSVSFNAGATGTQIGEGNSQK